MSAVGVATEHLTAPKGTSSGLLCRLASLESFVSPLLLSDGGTPLDLPQALKEHLRTSNTEPSSPQPLNKVIVLKAGLS